MAAPVVAAVEERGDPALCLKVRPATAVGVAGRA